MPQRETLLKLQWLSLREFTLVPLFWVQHCHNSTIGELGYLLERCKNMPQGPPLRICLSNLMYAGATVAQTRMQKPQHIHPKKPQESRRQRRNYWWILSLSARWRWPISRWERIGLNSNCSRSYIKISTVHKIRRNAHKYIHCSRWKKNNLRKHFVQRLWWPLVLNGSPISNSESRWGGIIPSSATQNTTCRNYEK